MQCASTVARFMFFCHVTSTQGGQRLEKPWKTLKSLEFVTGVLKTVYLKKKLEKHEFAFKKTLKF